MPKSQRAIVLICGSRSIKTLNLDYYIDPDHIGAVVTGGAAGVDTIAENWAKKHKKEWVCYLPQWDVYGKRAGLMRDEDMVNFCDVCIAFWDGQSRGTLYTIEYCKQIGRPYICHLVQELD